MFLAFECFILRIGIRHHKGEKMEKLKKLLKEEGWNKETISLAVNSEVPYRRFTTSGVKEPAPMITSCLKYSNKDKRKVID